MCSHWSAVMESHELKKKKHVKKIAHRFLFRKIKILAHGKKSVVFKARVPHKTKCLSGEI